MTVVARLAWLTMMRMRRSLEAHSSQTESLVMGPCRRVHSWTRINHHVVCHTCLLHTSFRALVRVGCHSLACGTSFECQNGHDSFSAVIVVWCSFAVTAGTATCSSVLRNWGLCNVVSSRTRISARDWHVHGRLCLFASASTGQLPGEKDYRFDAVQT